MNDERLGREIGAFYRETDVTPPDSQESARQVAARLKRTQQVRRRRWLPASRLRATHPPDDQQATEARSDSIPAANGRAPTVIGRTRTMFSPVKAITAGALVFALGGLFLIVQPFDLGGGVPGAEQAAELAPPVVVTITYSEGTGVEFEEVCTGDKPTVCTWGGSEQWSASDPRLSGTATEMTTEYFWGDYTEAYTIEVVNDKGAWVGTGRTTVARGFEPLTWYTLTGEGEYEGLTAVLTREWDPDLAKAVIIEGGLPPFPELPAE